MALLPITTPELVRASNPNYTAAEYDSVIAQKIQAVSKYAQRRMGRHLKSDDRRIEPYEMAVGRHTLLLKGMPIVSVATVKVGPIPDLTAITPLVSTLYWVKAATGQILFDRSVLCYDPNYVEVNYLGGMAATTDEFIEKWPDIAEEATNEVINRLNRSKNPEGNLATPFGNTVVYSKQLQVLESFDAALDSHPRFKV